MLSVFSQKGSLESSWSHIHFWNLQTSYDNALHLISLGQNPSILWKLQETRACTPNNSLTIYEKVHKEHYVFYLH